MSATNKTIKIHITNTGASAQPTLRIVWQDGTWYRIEVKAWEAASNATIHVGDTVTSPQQGEAQAE